MTSFEKVSPESQWDLRLSAEPWSAFATIPAHVAENPTSVGFLELFYWTAPRASFSGSQNSCRKLFPREACRVPRRTKQERNESTPVNSTQGFARKSSSA